jgi:uncharacterized membrane protein YhiD involved in acid resistance
MGELFDLQALSSTTLVFNLLVGVVLSAIISWYYVRFGEALSNRVKFARLLPVLCLIMILIITVIKGSLVLSLGLVGALSIVRFRTAIKDPEELLYLFLIIAVGLGLGADQWLPTVVATCAIMVVLVVTRLRSQRSQKRNLYLNIQVPEGETEGGLEAVNSILSRHAQAVDMRRLDRRDHTLQITYYVDCQDKGRLSELIHALSSGIPDSSFSFIEQDHMPV